MKTLRVPHTETMHAWAYLRTLGVKIEHNSTPHHEGGHAFPISDEEAARLVSEGLATPTGDPAVLTVVMGK